jgi:hypothetical protein
MGKEIREWQSGYAETQAHHVGISTQEDRGGTKGTVGEGEGAAEEGGIGPSDLGRNK